jgi:UDPglucose 6-dehydrogenase
MWNPLYGVRGGVPYGGACLPKDTAAFLEFVRERGMEHAMLEATMEVNRKLEQRVPAAASPDKIEAALAQVRARDAEMIEAHKLVLEVGAKQPAAAGVLVAKRGVITQVEGIGKAGVPISATMV